VFWPPIPEIRSPKSSFANLSFKKQLKDPIQIKHTLNEHRFELIDKKQNVLSNYSNPPS